MSQQAVPLTAAVLSPPYVSPAHLIEALRQEGHAAVSPEGVSALSQCSLTELDAVGAGWQDLPSDDYLKDGGRYRRRRHSCFIVEGDQVTQAAHRAHWQP
ncbi:MAG: 2OG-Fe dioxygenase family protein, partial [Burkholderiaceae bacterium]